MPQWITGIAPFPSYMITSECVKMAIFLYLYVSSAVYHAFACMNIHEYHSTTSFPAFQLNSDTRAFWLKCGFWVFKHPHSY